MAQVLVVSQPLPATYPSHSWAKELGHCSLIYDLRVIVDPVTGRLIMKQSEVEIQRWSGENRPDEAEIRQIYADEGLQPYRWSNAPGDVYSAHSHPYNKVIYFVRGSITFGLPDAGDQVTLRTGDRLDLPAGVVHNAVVGSDGVVCLEAHR